METKTKKIEVYVTKDGREWTDKKEAQAHEMSLINTKFFEVRYSPDLTEGRGMQGFMRVSVAGTGAKYDAELLLQDWCVRKFKGTVGFVMGCAHSPMPRWILREIDAEEFARNEPLANNLNAFIKKEVVQLKLIQNEKSGYLFEEEVEL